MEKKITSHLIKGIVIVGILIALDFILQSVYKPLPDGTRYMPRLAVVFLGVLVSCILYIRQDGGTQTFGEVFAHGFKTTAVIAFMMAAYTFVSIKFIEPPPGPAEMEAAIQSIEARGDTTHQEAVQQAIDGAKNRWVIYVSIAIFASLIPGSIASVFGGTLGKKSGAGSR